MPLFVTYILKVVLMLVISAYALDFGFTYTYGFASPKTKVQYLRSLKNQKFDYIFIGSSRVENSIIPAIIEQKTNKKTINLGVQGATTQDLVFIMDLLEDLNVTYGKVFLQLDYKINDVNQFSKKFQTELFPFLGTSKIIDSYVFATNKDKNALKYIPFYTYTVASQNLGLRNVVLTLFNLEHKITKNKGYVALYGSEKMNVEILPQYVSKNRYLDQLLLTKKAVYFSCPLYSSIQTHSYFDQLKTSIPGFTDFTGSISKKTLFKDSYHLNHDGAVVFTNLIIQKLKL
jgi:hypothetical protein